MNSGGYMTTATTAEVIRYRVGDRVRFDVRGFGCGTIVAIDRDAATKPFTVQLDAPVKVHREGRDRLITVAYGSPDIITPEAI